MLNSASLLLIRKFSLNVFFFFFVNVYFMFHFFSYLLFPWEDSETIARKYTFYNGKMSLWWLMENFLEAIMGSKLERSFSLHPFRMEYSKIKRKHALATKNIYSDILHTFYNVSWIYILLIRMRVREACEW